MVVYGIFGLNSYRGVLTRVNNEKKELQSQLDRLQVEHNKTLRQKKQFKFVLILFVVLLGCAIGLFSLNDNLNITRDALSNANDTISMQNDSLNEKSVEISNLHDENDELDARRRAEESKRIAAENDLEALKKRIGDRQPFMIKSTSFSFANGYLSFDYYGMVEESVRIQVKAFNDSAESYSNTATISVSEGDHSARVYLSDRIDGQKWYSFEILKGNIILGGGRHKQ